MWPKFGYAHRIEKLEFEKNDHVQCDKKSLEVTSFLWHSAPSVCGLSQCYTSRNKNEKWFGEQIRCKIARNFPWMSVR